MSVQIIQGDALEKLREIPDESVNCCVTSPPYWGLRDYGVGGQLGMESTPEEYVEKMSFIFREVFRVLRNDGTLWLNLGDSYATGTKAGRQNSTGVLKHHNAQNVSRIGTPAGLKTKDLVGIPWRVAFALQSDGWYLRQDIIWSKPNPMPESVTDRCTKSHEYIFMMSKSEKYYYDHEAIKEPAKYPDDDIIGRASENHKRMPGEKVSGIRPRKKIKVPTGWDTGPGSHKKKTGRYKKSDKQRGHSRRHAGFNDRWDEMEKQEQCSGMRNKRSVWNVSTQGYKDAHFATFPPKLIRPCILAGCPQGGTVLDPFAGSGTTGMVSEEEGRNSILIELNPEYVEMIKRRTAQTGLFC